MCSQTVLNYFDHELVFSLKAYKPLWALNCIVITILFGIFVSFCFPFLLFANFTTLVHHLTSSRTYPQLTQTHQIIMKDRFKQKASQCIHEYVE